jgi:hypothetical protein
VLEGIVASFLTRLLGDFVQDIDADRLCVNVGAGHVELHELELRRDAVFRLAPDAPCVLHRGRIAKLSITIPWSALGSAPAIVAIDRVDVVLLPLAVATPSDTLAQRAVAKERQLALATSATATTATSTSTSNDDDGFMARLVTGLVNNVQLSIGCLHVSYVDLVSDRANPFVLGAVLRELSVQSTDAQWAPHFVSAAVPQLFKLARLDSFGLYCDALPRSFNLALLAESASPATDAHSWLLAPVSGTAKATLRQQQQLASDVDASVSLDVHFDLIDVRLSHAQYRALVSAFEASERERRSRAHRHERPPLRAARGESARRWWRYLAHSVTRERRARRERYKWSFMRRFIDAKRVYAPVWQKAAVLSIDALDAIERQCLESIEADWPADELIVFRALAELQLAREPALAVALRAAHQDAQRAASWSGWAASWFVAAPSTSATTAAAAGATAASASSLSEADIDRLCATIGVARRDADAQHVPTLVARRRVLTTKVDRASFVLERDGARVVEASMGGCATSLMHVENGVEFDADVATVSVVDSTVRDSAFPQLLASADVASDDAVSLVGLSCRTGALAGPDADVRVVLRLKPLRCVVHAPLLRSLVSFFDVSDRLDVAFVQAMEQDAVQRWNVWSQQAADNLALALEQSRRFVLAVDLHAPTLLIPLDPQSAQSPALLLDFGRLCIGNDAVDGGHRGDADADADADIDERLYRPFRVSLSRARVGISLGDGQLDAADLVAPFDVSLRALVRRSRQAPLPRAVVSGQLPVLRIAFSAARSAMIVCIVRGVLDAVSPVRSSLAAVSASAPLADEAGAAAAAAAAVVDRVRVKLRVKQVFVALAHTDKRPLLNLQLHQTVIGVVVRANELAVRVTLQHLDVIDMLQQCGDELLVLASSRRPSADDDASPWRVEELGSGADDNALIDFAYTQTTVARGSTRQHVVLQLGLLLLQWNPLTMDALLATVFPPAAPAVAPSLTSSAPPPAAAWSLVVEARARRVGVVVNNDSQLWRASETRTDRRMLLLLFEDMQTRVSSSAGSATTTTGGLRSLLARDLMSPLRSPLLVVDSATVVDFEYVKQSPAGAAAGVDDTLRINMNSMRFVHWRARTDALIALYFYVMSHLGASGGAGGASADAPPPSTAARVVRFALAFDRPVIVVPVERDAVDGDALLIDLGVIRATNRRAEVPSDVVFAAFHNAAPENRRVDKCHLHCSDDASLFHLLDVADDQVRVGPLHDQHVRAPPTACERTTFVFTAMRIVCRIGGAEMLAVPNVSVTLDWDVRMSAPLPEQAFRVDVSDIVIALDERRTALLADCMARNMAVVSTEALPSGAVAGVPPRVPMTRASRQVVCFVSKFQIDLLDDSAALFSITLAHWRMLTVLELNGTAFSTFELEAIAIEDRDVAALKHAELTRRLLGATDVAFRAAERSGDAAPGDAASCNLSLQFVRFRDGEVTALGLLDSARFVVVAGRVEALLAALLPKTQLLLAAYGKWAAGGAAAVAAPGAVALQRYVLDVRSPNVYVVHDRDERCAALRLTATWFGSIDFRGADYRFAWRVRDASVSRCSLLDANAAHASVVAPFGYRLTWSSQRVDGLRVTAKFEQVSAMFSYRDLKLLYATAQRFRSRRDEAAPAALPAPPAMQDVSVELAGASIMLVNDCADANDPLLLILVDNTSMMAQNWAGDDALAFVALRVALDNYDVHSQEWMSLLEPYAVQLKWQRKLERAEPSPAPALSESSGDDDAAAIDELLYEDDGTGAAIEPFEFDDFGRVGQQKRTAGAAAGAAPRLHEQFTVFSDQPLHINVTQQFVHTATTLAQTWQSDFYAASRESDIDELFRSAPHSYMVANHMGVDVAMLQDADELERIAHDDRAPRVVEGLRVPMRFDARSRRESAGATLTLLLCGSFLPLSGVPLDAIGVRWARPSPDDPDAIVVCQTEARRGGRLLTVRSNVVFANATEFDLAVRAVDGSGRVLAQLGSLAPGARLALPVGLAHRCRVQLRPLAASLAALEWSSTSIDCGRLDDSRLQRLVRWSPADEGAALPFTVRYSVEHDKAVSMTSGARLMRQSHPRALHGAAEAVRDFCVVLRLPTRICNALPLPLTYAVRRAGSDVALLSGVVRSGEDVGVGVTAVAAAASAAGGAPLAIAFRLSGFEWTAAMPLSSAEEEVMLAAHDAAQRALPISLLSYLNHNSVRKLVLCCKFWIVNNTGLPLLVRDSEDAHRVAAGQVQLGALGDKFDLALSSEFINAAPLPFGAPVMRVKVADAQWSAPIRLESIGVAGACVDSSSARHERLYSVALSTHAVAGAPFHSTTAIVVSPRHVIRNATARTLLLRQRGAGEFVALLAGQSLPWHWPDRRAPPLLELSAMDEASDGVEWQWSGALSLTSLEQSCVCVPGVRHAGAERAAAHFEFEVAAVGASTVLTLTPASADVPLYRIVNRSSLTLEVRQRDDARSQRLSPGQSIAFAWNEPAASLERRVVIVSVERSSRSVAVQPAHLHTRHMLVKSRSGDKRDGIVVETHADGPTRTVLVRRSTDYDALDDVLQTTLQRGGSGGSGGGSERRRVSVEVTLNAIGISLIDHTPVEFAFARFDDVSVRLTNRGESGSSEFEVLVGAVRVDNQLIGTPFPALLRPSGVGGADGSFVHVSVVFDAQQAQLDWCKYVAMRVAEFNVQLEIVWLVKALSFVVDELLPSVASEDVGSFDMPQLFGGGGGGGGGGGAGGDASAQATARRTYVRTLHINPVRMFLSYLSGDAAGLDSARRHQLERRLGRLARLPASNVSNVENAQVTLSMLLLEHAFARRSDFLRRIVGHYRAQAVDQLYTLLFSADILGQPLSLVQSLGTGVHDFFHEPATKGVESLARNSVYGFANSFHKATGAIGTGVALLSLDARYQRERQQNRVRELPQDMGDGLLLAAKDFSKGIFDGITGIIAEPFRGARDEGIEGFGKGVVRGALGVAIKPAVGLFDAASRATQGVRNSAQHRRVWPRMRAPRVFDADDERIRPYDRARDTGRFFCRLLGVPACSYEWHTEPTPERVLLIHGATLSLLFVGTMLEEASEIWRVELGSIVELHVRPSTEQRDVLLLVATTPARGQLRSESVQFANRATMTGAMTHITERIASVPKAKQKTFAK